MNPIRLSEDPNILNMPSGMKAVKSVDGLIRIVSFLANQQVLLPTTVGSKVQNNVPLSTVNNQKGILLHIINTLHSVINS